MSLNYNVFVNVHTIYKIKNVKVNLGLRLGDIYILNNLELRTQNEINANNQISLGWL